MFRKASEVIEECESRGVHIKDLVLEEELKSSQINKDDILFNLKQMFKVMEESATGNLNHETKTAMGMIDGFAKKMNAYQKGLRTESKKDGEKSATISQQIEHLTESINEIKETTRETNQSISKYAERIIKLEAQQLGTEKRIDSIVNLLKERGKDIV